MEKSSFHFDFAIFGTNSLCAFALNLAVFLLVRKTSALTMNVAYYNHTKLQAMKAKEAQKKSQQADEESRKLLEEREE
ncbi:hypothetical protein Vadar_013362 [Vaccinium darrowii]|uniref:Uncharacterized protein n=1 Tax=Vaccinium darrowii TaxID=229202 RepID=A0ACB7YV61_9ERIC|nr:hypothetical protein Vadar_013362 [Vaccinium darrowii]